MIILRKLLKKKFSVKMLSARGDCFAFWLWPHRPHVANRYECSDRGVSSFRHSDAHDWIEK